jgi:hypothetical protein
MALPVVDGDNRELFISLGCAVENMLIAASHFGYTSRVSKSGVDGITVELTKGETVLEDNLFTMIERRQTNRSVYNGKLIPEDTLKQLQAIRREEAIQSYFFEVSMPSAHTITKYIMRGNEIQMSDAAFKEELLTWMRFNSKQVETTRNGLSYKVFGNPPLPKLLARPIVSRFLKPKVQNKADKKKRDSSSHFVLFTTRKNSLEEWVDLGRTLQRFLLNLTHMGIAYAFMNQPCEIMKLATALGKELSIDSEYLTLILRIGYSSSVPYSPRKKIKELL